MTTNTAIPSPEKASNKAINVLIKNIRKSQETNNLRVHRAMVLIAQHSQNYGDCTGFQRLLNALPPGLARNSGVIINTMADYTPIVSVLKSGVFSCHLAKAGSQQHKPYDVEGLEANPWFNRAGASKDPTLLDINTFAGKLLGMADGIEKKVKKGMAEEGQDTELLTLAARLREFAKTQVPSVIPAAMRPPVDENGDIVWTDYEEVDTNDNTSSTDTTDDDTIRLLAAG